MSVEKTGGRFLQQLIDNQLADEQQADELQADQLQQQRLDTARQAPRHVHASHRGQYGGCHYHARAFRSHRPPLRGVPLRGRPMPQGTRQRRLRLQMDEDLFDDRLQVDEREMQDDHDDPDSPFRQGDKPVRLAPQSDATGRDGEREGGQAFRWKLGPRREQPHVGERLIGMRVPGAAGLFGGTLSGPLNDTLSALQQVVLSTARSGTGLAARPPSLTRVAMMSSLAVLQGLPAASTSSWSLGDARTLSMANVAALWNDQRLAPDTTPEHVGNTVALLPLLTLNTQRPRTPGARQDAIDRLSMALKTGL